MREIQAVIFYFCQEKQNKNSKCLMGLHGTTPAAFLPLIPWGNVTITVYYTPLLSNRANDQSNFYCLYTNTHNNKKNKTKFKKKQQNIAFKTFQRAN